MMKRSPGSSITHALSLGHPWPNLGARDFVGCTCFLLLSVRKPKKPVCERVTDLAFLNELNTKPLVLEKSNGR